MKFLTIIITLPIAVLAVLFAIVNRGEVTIDLFGSGYEATAGVYLIVLLPFVLGFLLGGAMSWLTHGRYRKETRMHRRENKKLQTEIDKLSKELEKERKTYSAVPSGNEKTPVFKVIENDNA